MARIGLLILKDGAIDRQSLRAELAAVLQLLGKIPSEPGEPPGEFPRGHLPTQTDSEGRIETPEGAAPKEVSEAIKRYWPRDVWTDAARVSRYESRGWDHRAIRDTLYLAGGRCSVPIGSLPDGTPIVSEQSVGLFQINVCAHGRDRNHWEDIDNNVSYAASLYRREGWRPWSWTARHFGLLE